eukprot:2324017-Rhodomonas_salina.2
MNTAPTPQSVCRSNPLRLCALCTTSPPMTHRVFREKNNNNNRWQSLQSLQPPKIDFTGQKNVAKEG